MFSFFSIQIYKYYLIWQRNKAFIFKKLQVFLYVVKHVLFVRIIVFNYWMPEDVTVGVKHPDNVIHGIQWIVFWDPEEMYLCWGLCGVYRGVMCRVMCGGGDCRVIWRVIYRVFREEFRGLHPAKFGRLRVAVTLQ